MLTLYHNDMSTCSQKVRFVLATKGLDWDGIELNLRAGDQQRPEFLQLNPKGVVPVLVDDEEVLTESNIIMAYLEDRYSSVPLMPASPLARARVRAWMQRLDTGLHTHVAALSFAIAFRLQLLKLHDTEEKLATYFDNIPDPEFAAFYREIIPLGVEAPRFRKAVRAYDKLLGAIEDELGESTWLGGDELSLADAAYAPYLTRLEHLALEQLWSERPRVADWYTRLKETSGYRKGISDWFNPNYIPLMREAGEAQSQRISAIRARTR